MNVLNGNFNDFSVTLDDKDKFIFILKHGWKQCGNYIYDAWRIRRNWMAKV